MKLNTKCFTSREAFSKAEARLAKAYARLLRDAKYVIIIGKSETT
jgi:hypothetical protein